jgi:hypothetical protein
MNNLIQKILKEETENDDVEVRHQQLFSDAQYLKFFRILDKNPQYVLQEYFPSMDLSEEEYVNIIWKYFNDYNERKPYKIDVTFDAQELSNMFREDRDYDLKGMVEGILVGEEDMFYYYECHDVDTYIFSDINEENWKDIETIYRYEFEDDKEVTKEELEVFAEEELSSEIGCSYTEAQGQADRDYFLRDVLDGITEYLDNFPGKYNWGENQWESTIDIGDMVKSDAFYEELIGEMESTSPSLEDMFFRLISNELNEEYWTLEEGLFPLEKIYINTDKHFRYGGAGTVDENYFNELLSDRLYDRLPKD